MEYTIGEVSAIVALSRDMIRYYEKHGAIHANRNEANRYRTYDTMEVFWLLEAMVHKSWGVPISEIEGIRSEQYAVNTEKFLDREIDTREQESRYTALLSGRLRCIRDYMAFGSFNIGNFWVERVPPSWSFHLVSGRGDEYERINLPEEASRFIFSEQMLPFFDSGFTVIGDRVDWQMRIDDEYVCSLGAELPQGFEFLSGGPCLCTNIDIGEIGAFDPSVFNVIYGYAASRGYSIEEGSVIRGFILGRGYEGEHFRRIVRFYLPLTPR